MDRPETEVPPYFLCPISLQLMRDPVTLPTGVTYDRRSIEKWHSSYDRNTCPVTNQPLSDWTLTPNSTLLRLIQAWMISSASNNNNNNNNNNKLPSTASSSETPCTAAVAELVAELKEPKSQMKALAKIKGLILQDVDGECKACMEKEGITSLVASLATKPRSHAASTTSSLSSPSASIDEATCLLHSLSPSPQALKKLAELDKGELIASLSSTVQRGCYKARINAALLLNATFKVVGEPYKVDPPPDLFDGVVDILKDQNSDRAATMAALSVLTEVVPHGRNRARAVEAGVVAVLVELLVEERDHDRRRCEAMLALLGGLCARAEGRAAFLEHPAGVAAVAAKILRVSDTATEKAVKVLWSVCKFSAGGGAVVEEMMLVGGVAKLCMVVQVECTRKAKEMAKEILGLHLKTWNRFSCFPNNCMPSG